MKKDNLSRRDFLKLAAAFAAANALGACTPSAPTQEVGQEAGEEAVQPTAAPEMEVEVGKHPKASRSLSRGNSTT